MSIRDSTVPRSTGTVSVSRFRSYAPRVVGKFSDVVYPATMTEPDASTATALAPSSPPRLEPGRDGPKIGAAPRNVENTIWLPVASNFVTKASQPRLIGWTGALKTGSYAPGVVGKSSPLVSPTAIGAPVASTARS